MNVKVDAVVRKVCVCMCERVLVCACVGMCEYKRKRRPRKKPGRHPVLYTNSYLASLCVLLISFSGLELVGLIKEEWTWH